jgi:hypothetical protein
MNGLSEIKLDRFLAEETPAFCAEFSLMGAIVDRK